MDADRGVSRSRVGGRIGEWTIEPGISTESLALLLLALRLLLKRRLEQTNDYFVEHVL